MGIPAYFRWISEKYPLIMVDCIEQVHRDHTTGEEQYPDASAPNPNTEFHNLYLDMNGIIHPCTHPEDRPPPTTESEMFTAIFDYIDRIFSIVRPRRLLYMAIDGVAPRAKINQQRSRRFRAAQEAAEKLAMAEELQADWNKMGLRIAEEDDKPAAFDSNVITPGTPFMHRLAIALRAYVQERTLENSAWKDLVVVFSDASVPGEGEHKIAEYIRRERSMPGYDPNIRHVMYGLDADLIMLALATHEVHFTILREEVFPKRGRNNRGPQGPHNAQSSAPHQRHENRQPRQIDAPPQPEGEDVKNGLSTRAELGGRKPFHFLKVAALREYLDHEFRHDIESELKATADDLRADICYDLERVLDDFVFMCFFVGNDFLPHLPTLDIREGAIEYLVELYKTELPRIGYLTSSQGEVDFSRVRKLLMRTGMKEDQVFQERANRERMYAERNAREKEEKKGAMKRGTVRPAPDTMADGVSQSPKKRQALEKAKARVQGYQDAAFTMPTVPLGRKPQPRIGSGIANAAAAAALKATLERKAGKVETKVSSKATKAEPDTVSKVEEAKPEAENLGEKTRPEFEEALKQRLREKNELEVVDTIKLGEEGWKERYYRQKFGWGPEHLAEKQMLLRKYTEGLQWVMKYYYVGCPSWGWFYPYHYAPFASDLVECEIAEGDIEFELGQPFEPFTQLQAVMPASSGKLVLPKCYADLMSSPDSPIIDYYPEDFALDLNGKRFAWQGVALLPFIDEGRLRSAMEPLKDLLNVEENERNSFGRPCIMVHRESTLGQWRSKRTAKDDEDMKKVPVETAGGQVFGMLSYPLKEFGGHEKPVYTLRFELPKYSPHSSSLLLGATPDAAVLDDASKAESRWQGWKQAKFGPLGKAAKELISDRQRRISGKRSSRGNHSGRSSRGGFRPDLPVINRPVGNMSGAVSNMFGGLGRQQMGSTPGWINRQNAGMGVQSGTYAAAKYEDQGLYGMNTDPYREPSKAGGYYGAAGAPPGPPAQAGWGSGGVGWQQRQYGRGQGAPGGYHVPRGQGWGSDGYGGQGQGQGQQYGPQYEHHTRGGRGGADGGGGGLSGPAAASFRRRGSGRGYRGQHPGQQHGGRGNYGNWGGRY